jgi:hypothetical protein
MSGVRLILVAGITPMTNEKESVISVQSEYIERKKLELSNKAWNCDCELSLSNPQTVIVNKFLSDMAQEIFRCLPEELDVTQYMSQGAAFNSCRSTFLENIKKLTP